MKFLSILYFVFALGAVYIAALHHDDGFGFFRVGDEATTDVPICKHLKSCLSDTECGRTNGKSGKCVGALIGICDCSACIGGMPCKDDAKCGGLTGACDNRTHVCNCLQAAQQHYDENPSQKVKFPTLGLAVGQFCTKENCLNSTVQCYGLPCKRGVCIC